MGDTECVCEGWESECVNVFTTGWFVVNLYMMVDRGECVLRSDTVNVYIMMGKTNMHRCVRS